jgi:mono/diheme cytochrome c family protein
MKTSLRASCVLLGLAGAAAVSAFAACSSSSSNGSPTGNDAGTLDATAGDTSVENDAPATPDSPAGEDAPATSDAPTNDAPPTVTGMKIVTVSGAPLQANAGDAIPLQVVLTLSNGTTEPLPAGTQVTWTAPSTVVAQDPDDAGDNSTLPALDAQATAMFVQNPFRPERADYTGTLFVLDPGALDAGSTGTLTVTALVGDAGSLSATVAVSPTPAGDPDAGANLYLKVLNCAGCHGATGAGSPPADAGADASLVYVLQGTAYPYPAIGLNNTSPGGSPNVAADPGWSAALLGMAAQADIDNNGVALRRPMPDWLGKKKGGDGGVVSAQDFAHIYAFLKTQTQ